MLVSIPGLFVLSVALPVSLCGFDPAACRSAPCESILDEECAVVQYFLNHCFLIWLGDELLQVVARTSVLSV